MSSRRGATAAPPPAEEPVVDVQALLERDRARATAEALARAQAECEALAEAHAALEERRRREELEAFDAQALFQREVAAQGEALAAAQQQHAAAAQRVAEVEANAAQREAALQTAFAAERQLLHETVAGLQAKLDELAEFEQQRSALVAETRRLRQEREGDAQEAAEAVRALQLRLHELEQGGKADASRGQSGQAGTDAAGGEGACSQADLQHVLAHSHKMAAEMRAYGQVAAVEREGRAADELQREMRALEAERAGLVRDVQLKAELEAQFARHGVCQAREIRSARSKISSLEKGLEKTALEQQLRAQLADATAETNSLRRLLAVRTKELRHVRRLAQEVLLQRSDVEAFLISSIHHVRAELAAASSTAAGARLLAAAAAAAPAPTPCAPSAGQQCSSEPQASSCGSGLEPAAVAGPQQAPSGGSSPTAAGAGQADIRDLSWQDRERILRLLFAKINRAAMPKPPPVQEEASPPLLPLRGLATDAGPAGLA